MSDMQIRASDADRELVTQQLQQAFTEGRLDQFELEERLEAALSAKIHADLINIVEDLPAEQPPGDEVVVLRSVHDQIKRTGDWAVPRRLRITSKHGGVHLDFTQAAIPHRVIEVTLDLKYGSAKLVLPQDATANIDAFQSQYGGTSTADVPSRPRPGVLHVVVIGESKYGALAVRYPRKRWFTQA